ncbi:MAG: multicopper oxidase domain-containing protein, partial [Candidatus Limnocylindrales bacterium]
GDAAEQEHHALDMAAGMDTHAMETMAPGMPMAEPNELEVGPGETAELAWTFDEAGEQFMACHIAGHLEAGMQSAIEVVS